MPTINTKCSTRTPMPRARLRFHPISPTAQWLEPRRPSTTIAQSNAQRLDQSAKSGETCKSAIQSYTRMWPLKTIAAWRMPSSNQESQSRRVHSSWTARSSPKMSWSRLVLLFLRVLFAACLITMLTARALWRSPGRPRTIITLNFAKKVWSLTFHENSAWTRPSTWVRTSNMKRK